MTLDDVRDRVEEIRQIAGDDEDAHAQEDQLHRDVLRAIAAGASPAMWLAEEALRTTEIQFHRWCA